MKESKLKTQLNMRQILAADGAVGQAFAGFESRPQQVRMACAVQESFAEGRRLAVEAGTGVGKSFAYLIGAIDLVCRGAGKVLISTFTITLQEQLINKDIPFLADCMPGEFTAVLAKGRGNYLCKRRLEFALKKQAVLFYESGSHLAVIRHWSGQTEDGSLSELGFVPRSTVWDAVKSEHGNCRGRKCPHLQDCLYWRARRRLETYNLSPGDTLTLYKNRYKVVGIFETGVGYEDGAGILALREAQRLLNRPRSASFIFVDVENPEDADAVVATIDRRFPDVRSSLSSEFAQNTDDMQNGEAMMDAIGFLALFVGGIVVANTMMMSIYERTREIGTLRALGWRKGRILGQIVEESLLLCLLSAIIGSFIGILLMQLLAAAPGFGSFLAADWSAGIFARAIVLTLVIGLIAGAYPAWRASRLQPVEALRYE